MNTGKLGRTLFAGKRRVWKWIAWIIVILLLVDVGLGCYWSQEPALFPVERQTDAAPGQTTTRTLIRTVDTLLNKPGGYLSNDILPHRLWLDNMPNWEYGALVQIRDFTRVLRRDMSRSQSQSKADPDLLIAEPQLNFNSQSWAIPSTEGQYAIALKALKRYNKRLALPMTNDKKAYFYARADNLDAWLADVHNRLGAMSQHLADSVGRVKLGFDIPANEGAKETGNKDYKTPWVKIDDVFYQARGACWALVELMRAVEIDFGTVLKKKRAMTSYREVLRELEATQKPIHSPFILNGSPFGMFANHSLVLANYISRANAAIGSLRQLLQNG